MTYEDRSAAGAEPAEPSPAEVQTSKALNGGGQAPYGFIILALALLAGTAAGLLGEYTFGLVRPSKEAAENIRSFKKLNEELPGVTSINGALTFGLLGGLLGLGLGLAGGIAGESSGRPVRGAVAGLFLGAAAGALPALLVMPWVFRHRNDDPASLELLTPMLAHLALWSAVGLAAGFAFGIGSAARPVRLVATAFGGLVGAMIGTCVFEIAAATFFPFAHTSDPFSITWGTRLFARVCVAGFAGLGIICSLPPPPAVEAVPPTSSA
jgi:hypothetical protein